MERGEKKQFVGELHNRLKEAQGTFLVEYQGLNVVAINTLRRELRQIGVDFNVVKNRLLKHASAETDTGVLREHMQGPNAIALAYEDVVAPAKALVVFAKGNKKLVIKTGQISGLPMGPEDIHRLADLPGREVLLAQVLSAMQAVPASLVRVLNGALTQLLYALKAIEQQKAG